MQTNSLEAEDYNVLQQQNIACSQEFTGKPLEFHHSVHSPLHLLLENMVLSLLPFSNLRVPLIEVTKLEPIMQERLGKEVQVLSCGEEHQRCGFVFRTCTWCFALTCHFTKPSQLSCHFCSRFYSVKLALKQTLKYLKI